MSGSPTNILLNNTAPKRPEVNMGVTICGWTDRHVGTIFQVISETCFAFTEDDVVADKSKPFEMGHQNWICTPRPPTMPDGPRTFAMLHKDGRWRIAHRTPKGKLSITKKSKVVIVGHKDYYYDWSF